MQQLNLLQAGMLNARTKNKVLNGVLQEFSSILASEHMLIDVIANQLQSGLNE